MYENIPSSELKHVGKAEQRIDAAEKLTGQAIYAGDMKLPGMLQARVLQSPHASANIKSIDISAAIALPGVHAVLTGADLDYRVGLYLVDKYVMARGRVRHYGEAVAAVAAETQAIADRAIELIMVDYEVLEPVLGPVEAMAENAPLVHPDLESYDYVKAVFTPKPGTNIANHTKLRKGDVERGFAEADFIVEREYTNPSVQHVPMETHVAIGQWKIGDRVDIWTSAQSAFTVRNLFCHTFGLPHSNVRVTIPHVGGGFGGKAGISLEPLACLLSRAAKGRPVMLRATREEEFSLLACRSGLVYRIRTGVRRDGRITAQKMTMYWDSGAYADYAVNVTRASGYSAAGPYEIPNAWLDAFTIYTNKPFGTAYRGFGHVEFSWGLERHMNLLARTIGMDPYEFRKINAIREGSLTLTGEKITANSGNVTKCMDAVASEVAYGRLTPEEELYQSTTGRRIAKSVVALHKAPAMPPFTSTAVVVKMNEDSSVTVNLALTEIGAGTYTSIAQIVSEELKFPMSKVKIALEVDTDRDPYDWQTVASKGLLLSGNAAILAARDLISKAYEVACQILRCQSCDLDHDSDRIFLKHHPDNGVTFSQIAIGFAYPDGFGIGGPLIGVGRYTAQGLSNLDKETGQGHPALDWTYGAHGLVVGADPVTGEYDILAIASCFDVGRAINPGAVRGQSVGGVIQGLGTAMCEGYIYDSEGHLLNPNFTDNKILTSLDIPPEMVSMVVETPQIDGPFGARGVGEHSMIAICGALGNTIEDSIGADLTHMPVRQEDVWWALQDENTRARSPHPANPRIIEKVS
ncbi:MAG: xanthine dehydrogenase [Candidatus Wallbacteria bacterium HGW-Wallbacteria-1]|uniref:Xanthine dehydrogenase n=1 Tax=Candidatus Wallbacteria bacterium HGW-Wallbacteria-1 TaxID=2013854 RepID=A0A2N1PPR7_9BACT|nr:MAG: xanthine dehydrogenase [Candidatus Wallbacteria bacterium HGW-Wallbacteria-1]